MQQIHTFCVICCCLCLFDQSVVIIVCILCIVVSATCHPHIQEGDRVVVVCDPAVTCDGVVSVFTCLQECCPLLVVQGYFYAQFFFPHELQSFCYSFVSITGVVQVFYNRESFTVRISCICQKLSCFVTVCFIIRIGRFIVISAYCTEIVAICTICIIYTRRNKSAGFYLSGLCYLVYDVSTVDCQRECFTNSRIVERCFLCLEAYIVSSDIVYDLHISRSDQVSDLCLRYIFDEIKFTGVEAGQHSVLVIHQFEGDGFRSKVFYIIVVFIFLYYNLRVMCPLFQFVCTIGDIS